MAARVDLDIIFNNRGLERRDLNFKCPRKIINRIAAEIIDVWYLLGRALDVSEKKLIAIRCNNYLSLEEKAVAVLDAWAEEYGSGATCCQLAEALYDRCKKTNITEILCEEVTLHNQIKDDAMTSAAVYGVSHQPSDNKHGQQGDTNSIFIAYRIATYHAIIILWLLVTYSART